MTSSYLHAKPGRIWADTIRGAIIGKGDWLISESFSTTRGAREAADFFKALVLPFSTSTAGTAMLPVAQDLQAVLRSMTALGKLPTKRAPGRVRLPIGSGGARARFTGEGRPTPASAPAFEDLGQVVPGRVSTIVAFTAELAQAAGTASNDLFIADSTAAIVEEIDRATLDPASAATADQAESLTRSGTRFNWSGDTIANWDSDFERMVKALVNAGHALTSAYWIFHPVVATHLALKRGSSGAPAYPLISAKGGSLCGLPVIVSAALENAGSPGDYYAVLIEAGEVLVVDDDQLEVDIARSAAIQLDDNPSASAAPLTSLWANGLVGLLVRRWVGWAPRQPVVSVTLENITV